MCLAESCASHPLFKGQKANSTKHYNVNFNPGNGGLIRFTVSSFYDMYCVFLSSDLEIDIRTGDTVEIVTQGNETSKFFYA